jgi:uncharacterized protein
MHKIKLLALSLIFFFSAIIYSQDYSQNKPPSIEVTGNAQIKIEADQMDMHISINVNLDDLQDAKNKNDESTKQVLGILEDLNINDNDIATSGIRMSRNNLNYENYNKTKKYTVTNEIFVKSPNISSYENITTRLIKIDNVYLTNIGLSSTKSIETRVKAREEALLAAKKKAEDMAATYNMAIGKPIQIQENTGYYTPNPFNAVTNENQNDNSFDKLQGIFKSGLINVNASVKVIFLLIDKLN